MPGEGVSGLSGVDCLHAPTHPQWEWEVRAPFSVSLGDFDDLFGFHIDMGGFDLVGENLVL